VLVLMVSIVGIPWGIRQLIRYSFVPQTVMIDGCDGKDSLRQSTELVRGRWWYTALMMFVFNLLVAGSGLVAGLLLLLVAQGLPVWVFSGLVSLIYALIVPLAAGAQTYLYGDAWAERSSAESARAEPAEPAPA
jgi:hypothetical protein